MNLNCHIYAKYLRISLIISRGKRSGSENNLQRGHTHMRDVRIYIKVHIYLPEWMTSDYRIPVGGPTEPMHLRCSCKCNISLSLMHVRLSFKHSLTRDHTYMQVQVLQCEWSAKAYMYVCLYVVLLTTGSELKAYGPCRSADGSSELNCKDFSCTQRPPFWFFDVPACRAPIRCTDLN